MLPLGRNLSRSAMFGTVPSWRTRTRRAQALRESALVGAGGGGRNAHLLRRDGLDDLFLGSLELLEVVAVAEHAEVARDAAVGLDRDARQHLLALLEPEPVHVERVQADAVGRVRRVLAIVGVDGDDEPAQVVGDLRGVD